MCSEKKFECVLFDLDGTLMDTSSGILHCVDYIVGKFYLPYLEDETKRSFIGPPIQKSFQAHYGLSEERAWELATAWREAYKDTFLLEAEPYEGIYELLHSLRQNGIMTGVATNKREDYTLKLLEHFGFLPLFDCVVGSDFEGKRSKADMIRIGMERLGVDAPGACLMVGDTEGDMAAARAAGVGFLGVTYGFGFKKSDIIGRPMASDCRDIQRLILSNKTEQGEKT